MANNDWIITVTKRNIDFKTVILHREITTEFITVSEQTLSVTTSHRQLNSSRMKHRSYLQTKLNREPILYEPRYILKTCFGQFGQVEKYVRG